MDACDAGPVLSADAGRWAHLVHGARSHHVAVAANLDEVEQDEHNQGQGDRVSEVLGLAGLGPDGQVGNASLWTKPPARNRVLADPTGSHRCRKGQWRSAACEMSALRLQAQEARALVRTSGTRMPGTASIAQRPFCSSACWNHFRFSGSAPAGEPPQQGYR